MSLLFYVGKRRGYKTFAGAKVQQKNDICKKREIFLRKMSKYIWTQWTKLALRNSGEE